MLRCMLLSFFFAGMVCNAFDGTDLTDDFYSHQSADGGLSRSHVSQLSKYKVLLVRGYVADVDFRDIFRGGISRWEFARGYFAEQIKLLNELGVESQLVDINTGGSMPQNSEKIVNAIEASEKPVIIISQSKGGLDTMDTLINYPEVRKKVKGWLAWQSPFHGTPMADLPGQVGSWAQTAVGWFLKLIGGNEISIEEMATANRALYLEEHKSEIQQVLSEVTTISFGSFVPKIPKTFNTILGASRDYLEGLGLKNDGLVPLASTLIPGSNYVSIEGVDHLCPVFEYKLIECKRNPMTKSFLAMLVERF